jgi:hypothetical protein
VGDSHPWSTKKVLRLTEDQQEKDFLLYIINVFDVFIAVFLYHFFLQPGDPLRIRGFASPDFPGFAQLI